MVTHKQCCGPRCFLVFAAMAAPGPANLSRVQARHLGAKGKPIQSFFKKVDSSNAVQAEADKQHKRTKKADEDRKGKAADPAAVQPTVGLGVYAGTNVDIWALHILEHCP